MPEENNLNQNIKPIKLILLTGLLVGSLDIISAFVDYYIARGGNPFIVLRFIASGIFRNTALTGSGIMYFWGLLFHFIIAYSFTFLFYFIYPKINLIRLNPFLTALLYGLFIWAIMNMVIVPLVFSQPWHYNGIKTIKAALILIVMIGLPLSFIMRKHFSTAKS